MNYKILTTVSAVALLAFTPFANAEDVDSASKTRVEAQTGIEQNTQIVDPAANTKAAVAADKAKAKIDTQAEMRTGAQSGEASDRVDVEMNAKSTSKPVTEDLKEGWNNTKEAVVNTADRVEYTLFGKDAKGTKSDVSRSATANAVLGQPVVNEKLSRIGTLSDIVVDAKGKATLAVISDGDFAAIGKEAAFDYNSVLKTNAEGDLVTPLTEESLKKAQKFSADRTKKGATTIPAGSYSIKEILDADIVDDNGKEVASVDNVIFRNGRAESLVVGFDKVMGLGGKKAALAFSDVKMMMKEDGDVNIQLTAAQATQFETFTKSATSN